MRILALMILACNWLPGRSFEPGPGGGVNCRLELERGVLPSGGPQRTVLKVALDPAKTRLVTARPAVNVAVVLDKSGSMAGEKLERAVQGTIQALRRLGPGDIFSVIVYSSSVTTLVPAGPVAQMDAIIAKLSAITASGETALFGGVSQGAAEIRKHLGGPYIHRVILLSDGQANVGPSEPADLGRLGTALQKEGISVTTVGVGTDYNEDLMTWLSQGSDGNAYFAANEEVLPEIFASELGEILNVVAQKVDITIEFPESVKPLRIIGREGRIAGKRVELSLNQLYAGQEKYALIEVEVASGRPSETREVALARVAYHDVLQQRREEALGRVSVQFSDEEKEVMASVNRAVIRDQTVNDYAEQQLNVTEYVDKGQADQGYELLENQNAVLRQKAEETGDADLKERAVQMEELTSKIKREGMTKENRKLLKTDSLQTRSQQKRQLDEKKPPQQPDNP